MGCDISLYVEVRQPDGSWKYAESSKTGKGIAGWSWYDGRNYDLFGILADVRNSAGLESIAPRRGLPDDMSPEMQSISKDCWDKHSHSWATLDEILAYDWDKPRKTRFNTEESVRELCSGFLTTTVPKFKELGNPEDVRLLFWFDS